MSTDESGTDAAGTDESGADEREKQIGAPRYRFDDFVLDVRDCLLVEKDRFFDEVWGDVVVSESTLTQCIKEIRIQLWDDASNPRCVQTVPRHGYRFIGSVDLLTNEGSIQGRLGERIVRSRLKTEEPTASIAIAAGRSECGVRPCRVGRGAARRWGRRDDWRAALRIRARLS